MYCYAHIYIYMCFFQTRASTLVLSRVSFTTHPKKPKASWQRGARMTWCQPTRVLQAINPPIPWQRIPFLGDKKSWEFKSNKLSGVCHFDGSWGHFLEWFFLPEMAEGWRDVSIIFCCKMLAFILVDVETPSIAEVCPFFGWEGGQNLPASIP